jgi:hypothetical protein
VSNVTPLLDIMRQRDKARADAKALAEALKRVEWTFSPYEQENYCPSCHSAQKDGHEQNCDLADALSRYRGEAK